MAGQTAFDNVQSIWGEHGPTSDDAGLLAERSPTTNIVFQSDLTCTTERCARSQVGVIIDWAIWPACAGSPEYSLSNAGATPGQASATDERHRAAISGGTEL